MPSRHKLQQYLAIFASQVTRNIFYAVVFFCFNLIFNVIAFFSFRFVGFFKKGFVYIINKNVFMWVRGCVECTQLMSGGNKMVDWLKKDGAVSFSFCVKKNPQFLS